MVTIVGPQGSPFCFLRDTIYVIRYLANVPLGRLVAVKRGAKVPRGPLLVRGGDMPEFSFLGTPHAAQHTIQSEGMLGPTPRPWGHKGEKYA